MAQLILYLHNEAQQWSGAVKIKIMENSIKKLETELKELQKSFESGQSGLSTNEYTSYYFQLYKKIKVKSQSK